MSNCRRKFKAYLKLLTEPLYFYTDKLHICTIFVYIITIYIHKISKNKLKVNM